MKTLNLPPPSQITAILAHWVSKELFLEREERREKRKKEKEKKDEERERERERERKRERSGFISFFFCRPPKKIFFSSKKW